MKNILVIISIVSCVTAGATNIPTKNELRGLVHNYVVMDDKVASSAAPTSQNLKTLQNHGFTTIVDLRTEKEGTTLEIARVQSLKMHYVSIPIKDTVSPGDVKRFKDTIDKSKGFVLIHCSSGNRAGGLWAMYRASEGIPVEQAIDEGRKAGLTKSLSSRLFADRKMCQSNKVKL